MSKDSLYNIGKSKKLTGIGVTAAIDVLGTSRGCQVYSNDSSTTELQQETDRAKQISYELLPILCN
ncbi:MAG: hypothetical protein ACRD47_12600 [Nitrososphaeraceae archaeon]